ncbi:PREDICTED: uncharacterized protein LOC101302857 [Fragaria vesca subsp. vesca]
MIVENAVAGTDNGSNGAHCTNGGNMLVENAIAGTENGLNGAHCTNGGNMLVENAGTCLVQNNLSALSESELNALQFGGNLGQNLPQELEFIVQQNYNDHSMMTRAKNDITDIVEPKSFRAAAGKAEWDQAMLEEIEALQKQGTWTLVPCPSNRNIVGSKWIFKVKKNPDGSISRYKARLVAQGFSQSKGLDYDETFSPVVRHNTVRMILALAAMNNWELRQLDVKNAFLHGVLKEEVYMSQPQGSDTAGIHEVISELSMVFDMKDLGSLSYFLGLEVTKVRKGILLSQTKYAKDLLAKAGMESINTCSSPCLPHAQMTVDQGTPLADPTVYRSIVGALQYLTFTRPDIAYAVNTVCQFMTNPTDVHYAAVKRILRYLKGTIQKGIFYSSTGALSNAVTVKAFCDADWAGEVIQKRSTTGFIVYLGLCPVSWQSKKQGTVSRSSTESEYRSLANTAAEIS